MQDLKNPKPWQLGRDFGVSPMYSTFPSPPKISLSKKHLHPPGSTKRKLPWGAPGGGAATMKGPHL